MTRHPQLELWIHTYYGSIGESLIDAAHVGPTESTKIKDLGSGNPHGHGIY